MQVKQTNRVTMFKTVRDYLAQNNSIWTSMTPLATAVQDFNNKLTAIDAAAQKQETPTGATTNKASARDALEDVLFLTSEALGVLAHNEDDHDLLALTALTPSDLVRMSDEELANRAASTLAQTITRKTALAALHVSQENLDELDEALQNFNTSKSAPRTATAKRMAQTESLPDLIRDASSILRHQIDRMVNLFRRSHPDFVAGYRGARVIVDRAASHRPASTAGTPAPQPTA